MSWEDIVLIAICVFGGLTLLGLAAWAVTVVLVLRKGRG